MSEKYQKVMKNIIISKCSEKYQKVMKKTNKNMKMCQNIQDIVNKSKNIQIAANITTYYKATMKSLKSIKKL